MCQGIESALVQHKFPLSRRLYFAIHYILNARNPESKGTIGILFSQGNMKKTSPMHKCLLKRVSNPETALYPRSTSSMVKPGGWCKITLANVDLLAQAPGTRMELPPFFSPWSSLIHYPY